MRTASSPDQRAALGARRRASIAWGSAYLAVVLLPVIAMVAAPEAGEPTKQFAIALGLATWMGMAMQVVLAARVPAATRSIGADVLLRLHRYMGVVLLATLVTHVVVFLLRRPERLQWFVFLEREPKAWTGTIAWWAMLAIAGTSIWRRRLGWSYERWRVVHVALTAAAMFAAYLHMLTAGDYVTWQPLRILVTLPLLLAVVAVVYLRVGRAFQATASPYVVESVREELGGAVTVRMLAHGHPGLAFRPGDFAWLRCRGAPYAITEHPFSVASSTRDPRVVEFTCKVVGDGTSALRSLRPGATVYVDGPHGVGRPRLDAPGHVLVTAGIGITPAMSLLRSLADDPARRHAPVLLLHGARARADITFGPELDDLSRRLPNLRCVYALSRPEHDWNGHVGRIDPSLLERVAGPGATAGWEVFACGPPDLLATVEHTFARLGVPAAHVHVERFEGA